MVQVKYKGQNTLYVGGYKIVNGFNEIKDEDFWKLMNTKTFRFRVENKILEVPAGFPLEKPAKEKPESPSDEHETEEKDEHEGENVGRLSVKVTLKNIEKSEDVEYLQNLIDKDSRPKVQEEAKKKLKNLK